MDPIAELQFIKTHTIHVSNEQAFSILTHIKMIENISNKYSNQSDDWSPDDEQTIERIKSIIATHIIDAITSPITKE